MGVPGYFLAGGVFADHGFAEGGSVKGVPEDKAGEIDTSWLRERLRKCHEIDVEGRVRRKPVCKNIVHPPLSTPTFTLDTRNDNVLKAKLNCGVCEK